jgi:hypothetical protein
MKILKCDLSCQSKARSEQEHPIPLLPETPLKKSKQFQHLNFKTIIIIIKWLYSTNRALASAF